MQSKNPQGIVRMIKAAKYSYQGALAAFRGEAAFREEVIMCLILIPVAFWLDVSAMERLLMIVSLLLVLLVELLNSAIEAVVDRVSTAHHPLSGQAKDMGSAAVLISIVIAVLTWVTVLV